MPPNEGLKPGSFLNIIEDAGSMNVVVCNYLEGIGLIV